MSLILLIVFGIGTCCFWSAGGGFFWTCAISTGIFLFWNLSKWGVLGETLNEVIIEWDFGGGFDDFDGGDYD